MNYNKTKDENKKTKDENKKTSKKKINKLLKEKSLYESAYELFSDKGINDTSIDDIVKKAGVAKGTFYLYFKDKYDIINRIILKKSFAVLREALYTTMNQNFDDFFDHFIEKVIFFTDYIIEYFRQNKRLLRLIHKNLSWGIYRRVLVSNEQYEEMKEIQMLLNKIMVEENLNERDFEIKLFMIIELTSSVCYSSIILEEPTSIEEMKPELFKTIRKMLAN